ncbi:hypothetical protein KC902_03220 [Candidatus Kaiserbacteria bacterium]|nr:hypothetical protein [Candidatus Kaiserbacteria bacterium]
MNPTETPVTKSPAEQLADIKAQAANIVSLAQKKDPNIKISAANAEMIGLPKVNIPTQTERKNRTTELDMVGTTPVPKTSTDIARETILSKVKPEDRDTIDQILGIATDYQTEKGRQYETQYTDLLQQQLGTATSARDRALESGQMKEAAQLPQLEAELESIRGEADVLEARRNSAIQAESRRSGVSTSAMQGNINAIDRDFNLEKANLAIRELASVGKINAATKLIEAKLDIKYGDLEAETNLLTAQINAIKPFLDREDAKAADLRLQMNDIVKTSIADARAEDQALEEFKLQSYQFAQQNGATPALLSQIMSSTSRGDVLSVGGSFVQDPMTKLSLERERKEIAQIGVAKGSSASGSSIESVANAALLGTTDDPILAMIQASKGGRVLTQSEVEPLTNARRVTAQLDSIISSDIADNTGPLLGIIRSNNPYDVKAQELKASITALVPQLARGIYGEVGVLTDSDVARYVQTLPNMRSTDDVNKAVMGLTLRNVRNAFASQLESMAAAGRDVSGYVSIYNDMNNKINSIETELGIGKQEAMTDEALDQEFSQFQQQTSQSTAQEDNSPGFWKSIGKFFFGE